jgi:hypothetical protein
MEQPIKDADKLYTRSLAIVLNFFSSKLQLYYSSSRLTLLLTFLGTRHLATYSIPLPSRLQIADDNSLGLHSAGGFYADWDWKIFQDFLDSSDAPLALDGQKYAIAAFACLKILFGHYLAPVWRFAWFSQHCRALRMGIANHSQRRHTDLPVGTYWGKNINAYWHLRTRLPNGMPQTDLTDEDTLFDQRIIRSSRSDHLQFILQKSAYSDKILHFARYRVFRFGYLHRKHHTDIKKAIFALAKYIQRVTGETAEVRVCESIWERDEWFTAQ